VRGSVGGFSAEDEATFREIPLDHVVLDQRLLRVGIKLNPEARVRVDVVVGDPRVSRRVGVNAVRVVVPVITTVVDPVIAQHGLPCAAPARASDVDTTFRDMAIRYVGVTDCYVVAIDLDCVLAAARPVDVETGKPPIVRAGFELDVPAECRFRAWSCP